MSVIPLFPRTIDQRLDRIAKRLFVLLREEKYPQSAMSAVLDRLEENDLWHGSMDARNVDRGYPPFFGFVQNAIVENLSLREAVGSMHREFEPIYCETIGDLISNLLPSDGHLD